MKIFLSIIFSLFVGFVGGLGVGAFTGGYGGSVIGLCIYNNVAINSKVLSVDDTKKIAKSLAKKIIEKGDDMMWLAENTEIEGDEYCDAFTKEVRTELENLKAAQ